MEGESASQPSSRTSERSPDRHGFQLGAAVAGLLLTASWTWWGLKQGAYFPAVFNPGIVVLCAGLILLLWSAPWHARLSLSRPARVCALAMVGLAVWTLASGLWSPSPDVSISDSQRVLAYLTAFALGAWFCNMLGWRMELGLLPVILAAGIVGIVTVVQMLHSTDLSRILETDGTLQYPLGYRNANAAFFFIAAWPALALATHRAVDARLRLLSVVVASLSIGLGALCQSRGSFAGVAVALVVYLIATPKPLRAMIWLLVAALPLVIVIPLASDLFQAAQGGKISADLEPLRAAGRGACAGAALAAVLGSLLLAFERQHPQRIAPAWATRRKGALAALIVVLVALLGFTVKVGNPVGWVGDRFNQFEAGEPDLTQSSSRFTLNTGSNRSDVWRVAIDASKDDPLFGDGSGGFQYRYLRDRHSVSQVARDSHSVELETLSELGLPGFILLVLALGGATFAIVRSRKLGPNAAVLSAGALAAGSYWLVHSSFDWFWSYPAITAPVFGLAGAACAPSMLDLRSTLRYQRIRLALGICAVLLAVSVVPGYLSGLYLDNAYGEFRADLPAAYDDLSKARSLNPLSDEPILAEGAIANAAGDREHAISAFQEAIRKRPEEWAGHFFLAQIYAKGQTNLALGQVDAAAKLNPLSDQLAPLRARIKRLSSPR